MCDTDINSSIFVSGTTTWSASHRCQYWYTERAEAAAGAYVRDFPPNNGFVLTAGKGPVVLEDPVVVRASSIGKGKATKQINRKVVLDPAVPQFWRVLAREHEEEEGGMA